MGIFDFIKSEKNTSNSSNIYTPQNEQDAWMAILCTLINIDGVVLESETQCVANIVTSKTFFDGYDTLHYYKRAVEHRDKFGIESVLQGCIPLISEENAATFFCILLEVALSDGHLADKEKNLIGRIQKDLSISDERTENIIEIMLIKTKYDRNLFAAGASL